MVTSWVKLESRKLENQAEMDSSLGCQAHSWEKLECSRGQWVRFFVPENLHSHATSASAVGPFAAPPVASPVAFGRR